MKLECSECGLEVPSNASNHWAHCPLCIVKESINRYQDSHTSTREVKKKRLYDVYYQLLQAQLWLIAYTEELLQ